MRVFNNLDEFAAAAGDNLGVSEWLTVDQEQITAFAEATGDRQWIHIDPVRAADGPFKTTIAHGLLTLSLLPVLMNDVYVVNGISLAINYGLNKVRYPAPVPVDSAVRLHVTLAGVEVLNPSTVQATLAGTLEVRGGSKPACVLESIVRYIR
ncbi:MAG TPA: MaoC family dehydratase [Sporichthyaceae bacterium]